jgi:hypothetical protein
VLENEDGEENKADFGLLGALGALGPVDGDGEPMRAKGLLRTDIMAVISEIGTTFELFNGGVWRSSRLGECRLLLTMYFVDIQIYHR